jgi:hypothetical protein
MKKDTKQGARKKSKNTKDSQAAKEWIFWGRME